MRVPLSLIAAFPLPLPHSGPRRLDVDASGIVWIPAYAANLLLLFDPATRSFTAIPLPFPDALPYIIRASPEAGALWIGTGIADAPLRYDPASGQRMEPHPESLGESPECSRGTTTPDSWRS